MKATSDYRGMEGTFFEALHYSTFQIRKEHKHLARGQDCKRSPGYVLVLIRVLKLVHL